MTIELNNIIYELNDNAKTAKLIKCLSNAASINIPSIIHDADSNGNSMDFELESISDSAFKDCENLQTITFGSSNKIKHIGNNAFKNCISIEEIALPNGIDHIGFGCFCNCSNLKKVTTNASIKRICASAFEDCKSLNSIDDLITDNLLYINKNAFKGCKNLNIRKQINSIKRIDKHAFENCQSAVITGKKLKYHNGAKFESINNNIKKKWTYPNNKLWLLWPFIALAIYSFIYPYIPTSNLASTIMFVILSFLFLFLFFVILNYINHKKSVLAEIAKYLSLAFSLFFLLGAIIIWEKPAGNIFDSVLLRQSSQNGYYEVSSNLTKPDLSMKIKNTVQTINTHYVVQSDTNDNTTCIQELSLENDKESFIKIMNYVNNDTPIDEVKLDYESNGNVALIIKTVNPNVPLYIEYNEQPLIGLVFDDKNICEVDVQNNSNFNILTTNDINSNKLNEYFLSFTIDKSEYTSIPEWALILSTIIAIILFVLLSIVIGLIFSHIEKIGQIVVNYNWLFALIGIVLSYFIAKSSRSYLADFIKDFSSIISQV